MKRYNKENRVESAKERQEARSKRTASQQVKELDIRLGEGEGATKERKRLQKILEENKVKNKKKENHEHHRSANSRI